MGKVVLSIILGALASLLGAVVFQYGINSLITYFSLGQTLSFVHSLGVYFIFSSLVGLSTAGKEVKLYNKQNKDTVEEGYGQITAEWFATIIVTLGMWLSIWIINMIIF